MSKIIVARKYVKAILTKFDIKEIAEICENLDKICKAFEFEKFKNIIFSPDITREKKSEFILSFVKNPDKNFQNFIKLISQNGRLEILPEILSSLRSEISKMNNEYKGFVYSKKEISKDEITELEKSCSRRFKCKVDLNFVQNNYNGIKVDLCDLGVEISFSIDRLKEKMSEYILKAI